MQVACEDLHTLKNEKIKFMFIKASVPKLSNLPYYLSNRGATIGQSRNCNLYVILRINEIWIFHCYCYCRVLESRTELSFSRWLYLDMCLSTNERLWKELKSSSRQSTSQTVIFSESKIVLATMQPVIMPIQISFMNVFIENILRLWMAIWFCFF